MLSVEAAQKIILEHAGPLPPRVVPLDAQALGLILAEEVASDRDMPPFDKALMDGYAVRAADLAEGQGVLEVVEEITAGRTPTKTVGSGQAARIMTGAPIPAGASAVVMVERTTMLDDRRVRIEDKPPRSGQHILTRGQEMRTGEVVLAPGMRLRPQEFGVLATVGKTSMQAIPAPRVAIVSTGDEVVEPHLKPGPGQIRNGSSLMILAQVVRAGGVPRFLGIARDTVESLEEKIHEGLQSDVLVLMGGVSAGKLDLVPQVLASRGVEALVHKVEMKPGKPLLFGILKKEPTPTLVFGLPGNPVSSLVCFELFARPALRALAGHRNPGPCWVEATLEANFAYKTDRLTYHPALLKSTGAGWSVRPVPWFGSPDLRGVLPANAFVLFSPGDRQYREGQMCSVMRIENDV